MNVINLSSDNLSGAAEIIDKACDIFKKHADELPDENPLHALREIAWQIVASQPQMAPLFNLANSVLINCQNIQNRDELSDCVKRTVLFARKHKKTAEKSILQHCRSLLSDGVVIGTISRSSMVMKTLISLSQEEILFSVVLTESRPMNEGRKAAQELAEVKIPVTFMVDAAVQALVKKSDILFVGADAFSEQNVTNKIGTHALALTAQHYGKPVYCITTMDKFLPKDIHLPSEPPHAQNEVWRQAPSSISIWNHYFENTPLSLFAGVITEDGCLDNIAMSKIQKPVDSWLAQKIGAELS